jgi:hypothetical protein
MILKVDVLTAKQKNDFNGTSRKKTCARGVFMGKRIKRYTQVLQKTGMEQ